MGIINRKAKTNDTPATIASTEKQARPLGDVRSEIARLEAQRGEFVQKRDVLISDIARRWDDDTSDVQAEVGRIDIQLGALNRRLEWNKRDLYWAVLQATIDGYRQARVTRWAAVALNSADEAARRELRARHEAEMQALTHRANASGRLAHRAEKDAEQFVSMAVQMSGLDEQDTNEIYNDLREPIAAIDAEFKKGVPQDYEPPAELAAELRKIIEASTTPTPALVSQGLPPEALAALEAARANL